MSDDLDDGFGRYLIEYSFGNATYSIVIPAKSWDEAHERMRRIGSFGRVVGSNATAFPAHMGWWAKLLVWWSNLQDGRLQ